MAKLLTKLLFLLQVRASLSERNMLERRKHQRDDLMEVLNCAPLPNNSGSIFRGLIQDYSNSGLCLITNRAIEKGQEIIVNHRIMPSSKRATVKWQQNISEVAYKVGIEFKRE